MASTGRLFSFSCLVALPTAPNTAGSGGTSIPHPEGYRCPAEMHIYEIMYLSNKYPPILPLVEYFLSFGIFSQIRNRCQILSNGHRNHACGFDKENLTQIQIVN